jgi:hypothetical protein
VPPLPHHSERTEPLRLRQRRAGRKKGDQVLIPDGDATDRCICGRRPELLRSRSVEFRRPEARVLRSDQPLSVNEDVAQTPTVARAGDGDRAGLPDGNNPTDTVVTGLSSVKHEEQIVARAGDSAVARHLRTFQPHDQLWACSALLLHALSVRPSISSATRRRLPRGAVQTSAAERCPRAAPRKYADLRHRPGGRTARPIPAQCLL